MMRAAPKYWNETDKIVVAGVQIRESPTKLADILGKYVWVYSGDPEFPGDVEENFSDSCPDDDTFVANHSITIDAATPNAKRVASKDVHGGINWGTLKLNFTGLKRVRKGWSKKESVGWMASCWELVQEEDETEDQWLQPDGNSVGASKVLDDSGSPFLVFEWTLAGGGHSCWSGYYLGKKMKAGASWRMTSDECDRLGMDMTFRRVARVANQERKGDYEKVEYEEDEDEDDSSDEEEDGEDEDGEDGDGEDEDDENEGEGNGKSGGEDRELKKGTKDAEKEQEDGPKSAKPAQGKRKLQVSETKTGPTKRPRRAHS